jgi:hypothetical protein
MRNLKGATDYFLFFATNNRTGFVKMKEAMWRVDPEGVFTFSDATNPNQAVLFEPTPGFSKLRRQIERRFTGRTISVSEVERFVCENTAFLPTHYKRILAAMEKEQPPGLEIAFAKPGRRLGTFPPDTMIQFR